MKILKKIILLSTLAFTFTGCESKVENGLEDIGEAVEDTTEDAGDAVKDTAGDAKDAAEDVAEDTEEALKKKDR
ncbi:hypothetical protein GW915_06340 [bacterium]|nr:hypothetical protein [bacterium]